MIVRLGISVEGQTEEQFVKQMLCQHLLKFNVSAEVRIVHTGITARGTPARGGGINLDRVCQELRVLLPSFDYVTTLYDFYGFVGRLPQETADALQERITKAMREDNTPRLIPYVQQYEFETLMLTSPEEIARYFKMPQLAQDVSRVVNQAGGAEYVNDGYDTAPSRRLEKWTERAMMSFNKKTKVRHGASVCQRIGLGTIRKACPRFDRWLACLEGLKRR
jgi:Domain of unknown function (DUF4276)